MSDRMYKWIKRLGLPFFGLLVFVYSVHLTFPYERVLDNAVRQSDDIELSYSGVSPCWVPGCVKIKNARIKWSSGEANVKEIVAEVSILRALFSGGKSMEIGIDLAMGEGTISSTIDVDQGDSLTVKVKSNRLAMGSVPRIEKLVGIPMEGPLDADIDLKFPAAKNRGFAWVRPTGLVKIRCPDCVMGDGVEKVKFSMGRRQTAESQVEIAVPPIALGDFGGDVFVRDGKVVFEDFGGKSKDGYLNINGTIELKKKAKNWQMDQCWKFKVEETVKEFSIPAEKEGEPANEVGARFYQAINGYPKQSDGFTHMKWHGRQGNRRARKVRLPDRPCELGKPKRKPSTYRPTTIPKQPSSKSSSSDAAASSSSSSVASESDVSSASSASSKEEGLGTAPREDGDRPNDELDPEDFERDENGDPLELPPPGDGEPPPPEEGESPPLRPRRSVVD